MRCLTDTNRVARVAPLILLALATGSAVAGGRAGDAPAKACLQLESRPAAPGAPGCTRFVELRNSCDVDVVADLLKTQRLSSGTLRQAFSVLVPAGGEQSLDCAWWSGAMAPSEHQLLAAHFLVRPDRAETGEHCEGRR